MAVNPKLRLAYRAQPAPADDLPRRDGEVPRRQALARRRVQGHPEREAVGPRLAAVNIDTGKMAWKFDTEQPLIGGGLATAGDLVFFGEGNGIFNAPSTPQTGKKLWEFQLRRRRQCACRCRTWSAASSTSRWAAAATPSSTSSAATPCCVRFAAESGKTGRLRRPFIRRDLI